MRSSLSAKENPTPFPQAAIAVLIQITSPKILRRGQPLFPGFMAASVWRSHVSFSHCASMLLFFPLKIHSETEF